MGWQSYYRVFLEDSSNAPLIDLRGPYVGDERRQQEIIDSIVAGGTVFLVSAPPGCGKSRFALELARRLGRTQSSWDVRFVRHDEPEFKQEMHELTKAKRLVLIVDDAHHCPALVEQLAAFCSSQVDPPIHLICLTQPADRAVLAEALANHFPVGTPLDIDLGRPSTKLIRELIDKLIPQLSPHHRDVIRRFVADSFFATVLLCTSVARQKSLPQTLSIRNLRDYAIRQPVAQAVRDLCSVEKAFQALAVYAACAPVRSGDTLVRDSAAALAGLSTTAIETLEQRVVEANLLHRDARQWLRPVPDLVGALILEETSLNEQGSPTPFGQSLIRALFAQGLYEPVIRNCGDIARLFSAPVRADFLSELVLERANHLSAETPLETFELLDSCSGLAARQPGAIVRLVEVLTGKGALRADPGLQELGQSSNPEVRAQSLLATASEHDTTIVARAFEYSRRLLAYAGKESDCYRLLRDELLTSCRFAVARPLAHATAVLDVLNGWVLGSDVAAAELAMSVVHGFLQLEMHARRWDEDAPAPTSVSLSPADEIWKLRDRALELLVRGARHAAPTVQYAGAESLAHWAQGYTNLAPEARARWAPQLNRELDSLTESFGKLGSTTTHLPVRAAVERQAWRWWLDGPDLFIQRGGKRLLEALSPDSLPAANLYPLWKALHEAALPVFPLPLDESIEQPQRRAHSLASVEPSAERAAELSKELFDRLDPVFNGAPPAWSTAFTAVLNALPKQPLQAQAHVYLAEFVRRHPVEAWSFITEGSAEGPLGALLPTLLSELRGQDPGRWHEALQRSQPGTRLFEVELGALCAARELDPVERALVSKGLELEDADAVHLAAQALLSAAQSELAPGLAAVFAVLPRRPNDERLWDLALDAFARWGKHVLSAPEGAEADAEVRASSGELLRLLRTYGSGKDRAYTRHLTTVVAIFAVAIPHTLKSWMRELRSTAVDPTQGELALTLDRMTEVVRLIGKSPTASYWQKQFMEWITEEPSLAVVGGRGLAVLCGLTDPGIASLVIRVGQQPTTSALEGLAELVQSRGSSPRFMEEALTALRELVDIPEAYEVLEQVIIATLARDRSDPAQRGGVTDGRGARLEAIDRSLQNADLAAPLRETLGRARVAVQAAIEEDLLRGRGGAR